MKSIFYKIVIVAILLICFLLSGCAKQKPTENIIDNHIGHIDQVLDYAYNNMEQTKDVVFLEKELEACQLGLDDAKQSYKAEISLCESETDKWKVISFALGMLIVGGVLMKLKKVL